MEININESEFNTIINARGEINNLFENSIIYNQVYNALINKVPNDLVDNIISEYKNKVDKYSILIDDYYNSLIQYNDIMLESIGKECIELNEHIEKICKCEKTLYKNKNSCSLRSLVETFYDLCQKTIFSYQNLNLLDESFRKSGFIKELLCPYICRQQNEKRYFKYNLNDPFIAATLIGLCENVKVVCANKLNVEKIHLSVLKASLFSRLSERIFNRFVHINGETYRLVLNRHDSTFIACPRADLSSIDDIKPIRLFEKIMSFIMRQVKMCNVKKISINVCIIGHTEPLNLEDEKLREAELSDLLNFIMNWFANRGFEKKLNLKILNLVNQNDYTAVQRRISSVCPDDILVEKNISYGENTGTFIVKKYDYNVKFNFSTHYLCELIKCHDMTFILDCPWLTRENFELNKTVSMKYFCKKLNNCTINDALKIRIDKDQSSIMRNLNVQFNRIMGSDTFDAGKIIRILKDNIPRKIEETLSDFNDKDKVVYLFLSESTGVNYSYLNSYPLQRVELYEGKNFDIFQFCNYKIPIIENQYSENGINFMVRLWSITKYISIGYAYGYFRNIIKEIKLKCSNCDLKPSDYFDIYRYIFIQLSANSIDNIKINILFDEHLTKYFDSYGLMILFKEVSLLIVPLFKDVLFCNEHDEKAICNSQIRLAFSMNLYSSAKNPYEIYFWHKYRIALQTNDFRIFKKVEINNSLNFINEELSNGEVNIDGFSEDSDFFKDKWIYDIMLKHFEENDEVTINQSYIINSKAPIYYGEYCSDKEFVKKIKKVSELMDRNGTLYINCKNALNLL